MLTISVEQYRRINASFAKHRRFRLFRQLKEDGCVPVGIADGQAQEILERTIAEGDVINVESDEEVFRLARVVFLGTSGNIPEKEAALIGAVLANRSAPAADRLDFVENHILKLAGTRRWST